MNNNNWTGRGVLRKGCIVRKWLFVQVETRCIPDQKKSTTGQSHTGVMSEAQLLSQPITAEMITAANQSRHPAVWTDRVRVSQSVAQQTDWTAWLSTWWSQCDVGNITCCYNSCCDSKPKIRLSIMQKYGEILWYLSLRAVRRRSGGRRETGAGGVGDGCWERKQILQVWPSSSSDLPPGSALSSAHLLLPKRLPPTTLQLPLK